MFIAAVFTIFLICSNLCPLMGKQWKQFQTLFFGTPKITADGDCSHEIKRCLLLGRKVMTNLDSILNSRDITLPTEVRLVKAMVFPVVHHWLNGRDFEWTPGVGDGQGSLACCDSWGGKESDMTERLNWTDAHCVSDAIHHLILCHPLLLLPSIFPSIRVFSNELTLLLRWPKYRSFSFSISPYNEYSGRDSGYMFTYGWFTSLYSRN